MERKTIIKIVVICFLYLAFIVFIESEASGFVLELPMFFILLIGYSLLPTYFIFCAFENEYKKKYKQGLILATIISLIFCITLSFGFYYKYIVYNVIQKYNRLNSNYKEALENVIELSEETEECNNIHHNVDSFIKAFPNYYNYID